MASPKSKNMYVWHRYYDRHTTCTKKKKPPFQAVFHAKSDSSPSVSRVLSCTAIYLDLSSPTSSSDVHGIHRTDSPNDKYPILQRVGFTWHIALLQYRWALTSPFHPYRKWATPEGILKAKAKPQAAVYFCCTIPEVTLAWRYQAPCPILLGLSSWSIDPATV